MTSCSSHAAWATCCPGLTPFPGIQAEVERFIEITVVSQDVNGDEQVDRDEFRRGMTMLVQPGTQDLTPRIERTLHFFGRENALEQHAW